MQIFFVEKNDLTSRQSNFEVFIIVFFENLIIYNKSFKALNETEEAQLTTLRSIFELWKTHQQQMVVLVDKLLKTQIVECAAVANWLFSREMSSEFTKSYVWEILHLTIR